MIHFSRVIKGLEAPLVSGVEGLRSLVVVEAIADSAQSGSEVIIDDATSSDAAGSESPVVQKYQMF